MGRKPRWAEIADQLRSEAWEIDRYSGSWVWAVTGLEVGRGKLWNLLI